MTERNAYGYKLNVTFYRYSGQFSLTSSGTDNRNETGQLRLTHRLFVDIVMAHINLNMFSSVTCFFCFLMFFRGSHSQKITLHQKLEIKKRNYRKDGSLTKKDNSTCLDHAS